MRCILALLLAINLTTVNAQRLGLKLKSSNEKQDSLLSAFQPQKTFNDINDLKKEFETIVENLKYSGYFNLRYKDLEPVSDSVFQSEIFLNKRYSAVHIKNHNDYAEILKDEYALIEVQKLSSVLYDVLNMLSRQGKPFSQIRLTNIAFNPSDTISAEISLDISKTRQLDDIVIKGYDVFPPAFIRHYANIKKGEIFDKDKWIEKSEKLDLLRFTQQKQVPQVQFTKDSTKLFLYLEKQQANSFDGFIGFNNSEANEFQLNGNIDLNLINNFNTGEDIRLNYKNDGNAQEWFDAGIRLPYLFKSKFSIEAGLGFFKQDSTFSNTSQNIKLDYQITTDLSTGLKAGFENSSALLDNAIPDLDIRDFRKSRYSIETFYDKPKKMNRLFMTSQYVGLNFGIGRRESGIVAEDQLFAELNARQIFKINKRQFVFTGLNAAFLDSNDYLSNELYRFGGINTIRGFVENRFFANLFGTLQTEYRYILGSNLYVHSVLDYGFYENDIDSFSENLYAVGFGFGLETQAGVLRLILANGGSDTQSIEFANTQIHLKFLSTF